MGEKNSELIDNHKTESHHSKSSLRCLASQYFMLVTSILPHLQPIQPFVEDVAKIPVFKVHYHCIHELELGYDIISKGLSCPIITVVYKMELGYDIFSRVLLCSHS